MEVLPRKRLWVACVHIPMIFSLMFCLLATSGLDPSSHWELALEHAAHLQTITALPGRCTPHEHTFGKRPDITNLRTFGCEVLAYREKTREPNFSQKWIVAST
jgi:hypothetical protein